MLRSKQNSTYRGMTFIYFVTNSAWNPNTWAILCGILAVFLIVVLLTIYFIFRRLHIDLTILRTVFQEQKRPSHPATLTISDIPPGSETADLPQVPASAAKTKKQHTLLIIEDHLGDTPLPEADIQQRIQPTNGRKW